MGESPLANSRSPQETKKGFQARSNEVQAYRDLINKKTQPQVSQADLDDIFASVLS